MTALFALLRAEGVRRFRDGELEVEFAPPAPPSTSTRLIPFEDIVAAQGKPTKAAQPVDIYEDPDLYAAAGGGMPIFDDEGQS